MSRGNRMQTWPPCRESLCMIWKNSEKRLPLYNWSGHWVNFENFKETWLHASMHMLPNTTSPALVFFKAVTSTQAWACVLHGPHQAAVKSTTANPATPDTHNRGRIQWHVKLRQSSKLDSISVQISLNLNSSCKKIAKLITSAGMQLGLKPCVWKQINSSHDFFYKNE